MTNSQCTRVYNSNMFIKRDTAYTNLQLPALEELYTAKYQPALSKQKAFYNLVLFNPTDFCLVLWYINCCRLLILNPFLYIWAVLFQTIQFSINTLLSSILPIDRTLSGATTLVPSQPGSDDNIGVLDIPQSSSIIGDSPLSVISRKLFGWVLPLCRDAVGVFYSPSRQGNIPIILQLNLT